MNQFKIGDIVKLKKTKGKSENWDYITRNPHVDDNKDWINKDLIIITIGNIGEYNIIVKIKGIHNSSLYLSIKDIEPNYSYGIWA